MSKKKENRCDGEQRQREDWGEDFRVETALPVLRVIRSWVNSVVYCAQIRRAPCNCFVDFGNGRAWL